MYISTTYKFAYKNVTLWIGPLTGQDIHSTTK